MYGQGEMVIWAGWRVSAAQVELLADQPANAEHFAQPALDELMSRGAIGSPASVAALLARSLLLRDRDEEAEQAIRICRGTAADDQLDPQIKWRELLAVLSTRRSELERHSRWPRRRSRWPVRTQGQPRLGGQGAQPASPAGKS